MMERVEVSHEMIALVGAGGIGDHEWPTGAVAIDFAFGGAGTAPTFRYHARPDRVTLDADDAARLILIVCPAACRRVFGRLPACDGGAYHMPAAIRAIALALRDCTLPIAARDTYRLAKSIELLCETFGLLVDRPGELVPMIGEGQLSQADSQRIMAARRLIDERWSEKLTLDGIARACGLNRTKLTRGFREMFDSTVADALAEQRLGEARRMLRATDLPVSSIGYRCGYLNNASFTRAFARRFGVAPTQYRACKVAA
ncbi:MAG: helix-turn-helix domain-containing protein [Sphingobium sp.]